jgi:hypothetical protein
MDGTHFDTVIRGLARQTSRRGALGGLLAGIAALGAATGAAALKGRNRRDRNRDGGDDEIPQVPGTQAGGVWDATIDICHFNFEDGGYNIITVSAPELPQYLERGDTLFIDCCEIANCGPLTCYTVTDCIEGACMYTTTGGASCDLGNGVFGVCGKDGVCVGAPAAPVAPVTTVEVAPVG